MKRIKIILESKYFIVFVIILSIVISLFNYRKELPTVNDTFMIKSIKYDEDKVTITVDNVLIYYYGDLNFNIGDYIKVDGNLSLPSTNTNFNMFNYNLYLKSKKIYYVMNNPSIIIIGHNKNIFYKIKNAIINHIKNYDKKEYLYAFILGDTNYIDSDIKSSFQNNGISHLFAVSGMHVTLLSLVILFFLNHIRKNNINYFVVILFLLFYAFLTNYTPSIMRAVVMFILLWLNKIFKFNIRVNCVFVYVVCGFIIYNPYIIHNIGFLFSFIITYFLISFGSIINHYHNYFFKLFITSFIAFIASIPILINNFYQINLLSPFLNIIFVPFVSFLVFPLCILSFIFNKVSFVTNILFNVLEYLSLFFEKFSLKIFFCHIPVIVFIIYYMIIYYSLFKWQHGNKKYLMLLAIVLLIHANCFNIYPVIHILNVGQGDSLIIQLKYNNAVVIDTGGNYNGNGKIINYITIPYLKSIGIRKIKYLILTHGDYDHMGEAINLVNNFKVEKVIFNCGEFNDLEQELIKVLDKKKIKYYSCIKELNIDKNKLYFLQTKEYDNENDNSNVIYTELNGYKFMFMGDASITTEKEILSKYNLPDIDVLKVGHHGSRTSSSKEFINEINPKYSVISVGKNNRYGHPNKEVLDVLNNSKIYRTDQDGSIMFKIKNNKLKIETCEP